MTDPKAEALARLKWQERNSEANMALMSARDIFRDGVFDGYDARDEELAALKAEVERLRTFIVAIRDCDMFPGEHLLRVAARAALTAADRKVP